MNRDQIVLPTLGRMMVFVDGENIVQRFKAMLSNGGKPFEDVVYEQDIYVWRRNTVHPGLNQIIRATYYTYAFGDERRVNDVKEQIKKLKFDQYTEPEAWRATGKLLSNLYPRVFRKLKNKKAKGVDIQMTVDILTNVYMNNLDSVYLVSGDGDYKPILKEAIRHGKHVHVAAFSSGLNKELKYIADQFVDLDKIYFKPAEEPKTE